MRNIEVESFAGAKRMKTEAELDKIEIGELRGAREIADQQSDLLRGQLRIVWDVLDDSNGTADEKLAYLRSRLNSRSLMGC